MVPPQVVVGLVDRVGGWEHVEGRHGDTVETVDRPAGAAADHLALRMVGTGGRCTWAPTPGGRRVAS
ncbi:MAG: hypothetical protein ACRCY8_06850 [Dermatophilaceae bacterium]